MAPQKVIVMAEEINLDDLAFVQESELYVDEKSHGIRLDMFVLEETDDFTRSRIKNLIESGEIKVNGEIKKSGYSLKKGDVVNISIKPPVLMSLEPYDYPLDIVYQDNDLAVINKPRGMVTHPAPGSPKDTLVNALLYNLDNLSDINGVIRPGIVHRLDKDTSGLIMVAKTNKAHLSLSSQIATKECHRTYIALVDGNSRPLAGGGRYRERERRFVRYSPLFSASLHHPVPGRDDF